MDHNYGEKEKILLKLFFLEEEDGEGEKDTITGQPEKSWSRTYTLFQLQKKHSDLKSKVIHNMRVCQSRFFKKQKMPKVSFGICSNYLKNR